MTRVMSPRRRDPQERVRILVPRVASVDAVVVRAVPGAVELALTRQPAVPVRFLHRRAAALAPPGAGADPAADRIWGTLLAVPDARGVIRDDVVHFLHTVAPTPTATPPIAAPQRRAHARVDIIRPVAIVPDGFTVGWLNGTTRNLSAGGVLVAGASALEHGDRLRLRIELDAEDDLVDLLARVARSDERFGLRGLRLEGVGRTERERIVRYVFARQREALARAAARGAPGS